MCWCVCGFARSCDVILCVAMRLLVCVFCFVRLFVCVEFVCLFLCSCLRLRVRLCVGSFACLFDRLCVCVTLCAWVFVRLVRSFVWFGRFFVCLLVC